MTTFGRFFLFWFIFCLAMGYASLWVVGSAITSGIKAGTDNCGKTYPVEAVLSGDWFCPDERRK